MKKRKLGSCLLSYSHEQQQDFPKVECSTIIAVNKEKCLCKKTAYD